MARSSITPALLLVTAAFAATVPASAHASPPATAACANLPHADHPKTTLSNGALNAVLFLPDAANGYYRAARFDWAGVIGCVSLNGHTFFGEWFPRYDPLLNDSITGPVEEFRSPDTELGYTEAPAGGTFLKIGVGILRKPKDAPYNFFTEYPIVDTGKRTTHVSKHSVTFTQRITTTFGYAYLYEKTVRLDKHAAILTLEHKLTNLGTKPIESNVYDHDFFMLDHKPTGPGMVVRLGFPPVPDKPFPATATISGNEIAFTQIPTRGNSPQGYLTGYTGQPNEYSITLEDRAAHLSVEQTSLSPIAKFYLWSTPVTICPEAYIHISVAPGATQTWQIQYRFKAN